MSDTLEQLWLATEHPAAEGLAGCFALLVALVGPMVAGAGLAAVASAGFGLTYALGVVGALVGVAAFNRVLWQTVVYEWVARFVQWAAGYNLGSFSGGERA